MKTKITVVSQFCILSLIIAAFSLAGVARAEETPAGKSSSVTAKDKMFMKKAAKGGMMEVAMGKERKIAGKRANGQLELR